MMRSFRSGQVTWYFEDPALAGVVGRLPLERGERRGHLTYDYERGRLFVKIFREKGLIPGLRNRFASRGSHEFLVGRTLLGLSIPTAEPLAHGRGRGMSVIVQRWIEGENCLAVMRRDEERKVLLGLVAALLRSLEAGRIRHNDLHLENIILSGGKLFVVDLHKAEQRRRFDEDDHISNISRCLHMVYHTLTEDEKVHFFRVAGIPELRQKVEAALAGLWRRWIASKARRAFRTTSKLVVRGDSVCMRDAPAVREGGRLVAALKRDKKTGVERYGDHVRKYYRDARRLQRAWRNSVILTYMGLQDLIPGVFFVKKPGLWRKGYIAMDDLTGRGVELDRFLDGSYEDLGWRERRKVASGLAGFLSGAMHNGIGHRDLKACNIFVIHGDRFLFLDVEDIGFAAPDEAALKKALIQLNTTVPRRISTHERIRFFLQVTQKLQVDGKRLFREVTSESLKEQIVYEGVGGLKREAW